MVGRLKAEEEDGAEEELGRFLVNKSLDDMVKHSQQSEKVADFLIDSERSVSK